MDLSETYLAWANIDEISLVDAIERFIRKYEYPPESVIYWKSEFDNYYLLLGPIIKGE